MGQMPKKIWINAGEMSGDMHGALLMQAMQRQNPNIQFIGMGGAALQEAGLQCFFRVEELSVMGITEVLGHLPKIFKMLGQIKERMAKERPDAVIVIDAPDFHFQVIKAARSLGIPVYYYISPKLWAWRSSRAKFIKDNVKRLISILPFEKEFYKSFGMDIDYIGNPLVDMVDYQSIAHIQAEPLHIGVLPGSRKREIASLLPEFAKAGKELLKCFPGVRFSIIRAPNIPEDLITKHWDKNVPMTLVCPENRWAFMRSCELLLAASGTVTLESAIAGVPTIVAYKVSSSSYMIGKALVKIKYMSLPNIIMNEEVFPEFLQKEASGLNIAKKAQEFLTHDSGLREQTIHKLENVRKLLGEKHAPDRGAKIILDDWKI